MNRRQWLIALVASGAVPRLARAQQRTRTFRLGYLSQPSRESVEPVLQAFLARLRSLGWVEGRNLTIDYRWADGDADRLPTLAADLVRRKVDLIVAPAGQAALAAKNATDTIPIVMIFPVEPVELGLVASLSRPGGNVTGTTFAPGAEILGKQLQILKETVPHISRLAVLRDPKDRGWTGRSSLVEAAAQKIGVAVHYAAAATPEDFDNAFAEFAKERIDAVLVTGNPALLHRRHIAALAVSRKLPTIGGVREVAEAGALMAYGVNMTDFIGRAAEYVDKILRGANPADLPVEQPTRFELIINLKTANALGLTVPPSVLVRADEVIQ